MQGGSKGTKKNLTDFCGKPLIYWTIIAARKSKLISKIIVSTDCEEVREYSESLGLKIQSLRPKHLSNADNSSTLDVINFGD